MFLHENTGEAGTRQLDNMTTLSAQSSSCCWPTDSILGGWQCNEGHIWPQAQYRKVLNCWYPVLYITKLVSMGEVVKEEK